MHSGRFNLSYLLFLCFCFQGILSSAYSQDLEPRAYTNIPRGLNFVLAGYSYSAGGVVFDPTIPLENADIHIHGTVFAWARSIKVGPMSGKVDVILPYGWLSGSAEFDGQKLQGTYQAWLIRGYE